MTPLESRALLTRGDCASGKNRKFPTKKSLLQEATNIPKYMETKTANKAKRGDRGIHPKEKNKDKSPEEELNTIEISNLPEKTVFLFSH